MSHRTGIAAKPRIAFQTLGCPKNIVDSATLAGILNSAGFECVSQPHRADVLIVNTCGFVDDAKIEAVEVLLAAVQWKMSRPGRRIFAMGCLTQRDGGEVSESIPELDGVFGVGEWTRILAALGANPIKANAGLTRHSGTAGPGSAYLRISDGCSHECAFCSIPQMRGLFRSEPIDELITEAKGLVAGGAREIILIGQETTGYGVDLYRRRAIVELCHRLSEISGLKWIRLMYAHPPTTPPRLMEELAAVPKLAPYIDFPIEHASDHVLQLMNRKTTAARMRESISAFRAVLPESCVRTTALVGFPGETDEDFAILYEFMEEMRFERAGVFVYSPQEGTVGAELPHPVEEGIALDRLDRLMQLQRRICLEKHRALIGRTIEVLVERNARSASWGRSAWDAPEIDGRVRLNGLVPPGEMACMTVTAAYAYQVDGKLVLDSKETPLGESCRSSASSIHYSL